MTRTSESTLPRGGWAPPRAAAWLLVLGLFLTLRGYRSYDGDQAYRLPLLLHRQDPGLFADDPFVRAFDAFNPHGGYLALLDLSSRPLGLSAALAGLFAATFALTAVGIDRLARAAWPEKGPRVGLVAVGLVLAARAGNVGTNHLFEATLLDRLIGFGLGWVALAEAVARPERAWRTAPWAIGLAALVHPSVGLQLGLVLAASWAAWAAAKRRTGVAWAAALRSTAALALALTPGLLLNLGQGEQLLKGLDLDEFRLLSVELQGPQHMRPNLWRGAQWLAWGGYLALAALAWGRCGLRVEVEDHGPSSPAGRTETPAARARLMIVLGVLLAGLGPAWAAIEVVGDLRVTLFQPFRMATIARGLALAALSGRIVGLWDRGRALDRARAATLAAGLAGDLAFVVATMFEVVATAGDLAGHRWGRRAGPGFARAIAGLAWLALGWGTYWLARHDTESGHRLMVSAAGVAIASAAIGFRGWRMPAWTPRRMAWATAAAWAAPLAAMLVGASPAAEARWAAGLVGRWRFAAVPVDDVERLADWCRVHTPPSARFVGPPGPKTFRLWSRRSLAFNRAGGPYHAAGLADWARRYRAHVGFDGPNAALVAAYRADRHGLERRYQELGDAGRAALARGQGATHVVAAAPADDGSVRVAVKAPGPLELLHVEGRYAVYRVREAPAAHSSPLAGRREPPPAR